MYVSYGYNRTQMLRVPEAGGVEDRTVDGSCNPYLAATAVLAAGLDGIERGLDGDPVALNMYETTPSSARGSGSRRCPGTCSRRQCAEKCEVLRKAFGPARGEDYIDYYVGCKRRDWQLGHEQITQWGARSLSAAVLRPHIVTARCVAHRPLAM